MNISADLAVFFNTEEFAREFTHLATGVVFPAIFGVADQEGLDGFAITAEHEINYPFASVQLNDGDVIVDSGSDDVPAGTEWIVRGTPMRANDGRECTVLLSRSEP